MSRIIVNIMVVALGLGIAFVGFSAGLAGVFGILARQTDFPSYVPWLLQLGGVIGMCAGGALLFWSVKKFGSAMLRYFAGVAMVGFAGTLAWAAFGDYSFGARAMLGLIAFMMGAVALMCFVPRRQSPWTVC